MVATSTGGSLRDIAAGATRIGTARSTSAVARTGSRPTVAGVEYDPNRNARIVLLHYADGEKAYILAPLGVKVGDKVMSGAGLGHQARQRASASQYPGGNDRPRHRNASGRRGQDRTLGRGRCPADVEGERDGLAPACPLGRCGVVPLDCRATIGQVGNQEAELVKLGKAGRKRWKGVRPQSRGVVMNPVDHPLGGGEGRTSGGRHPVSPWGKPEGRTRKKKKSSNSMIVRRRSIGGRR